MILYKYRDWNYSIQKDGKPFYPHRTLLTDCALWFSSCKHFNDPFDCRIRPQYERLTDKQLELHFQDALNSGYPNASEQRRDAILQAAISLIRDNEAMTAQYQRLDEEKEKDLGICTLTICKKNILMWSHYAAYHTGFCVGIDKEMMEKALDRIYEESGTFITLEQVEYTNDYPDPLLRDPEEGEKDEWLTKQVCVKAKDWEYEREYRYILLWGTDTSIQIPRSAIREVVLGCQMPEKNQQEIIDVLRSRTERPTLYKAKKKDLEFGLDFEEIDY